jgi:hypothetical protein
MDPDPDPKLDPNPGGPKTNKSSDSGLVILKIS